MLLIITKKIQNNNIKIEKLKKSLKILKKSLKFLTEVSPICGSDSYGILYITKFIIYNIFGLIFNIFSNAIHSASEVAIGTSVI